MNEVLILTSYTLATIAGICFATGLAVLSGGRRNRIWMV